MKRFFVKVVYSNGCVIRGRKIGDELKEFFASLNMSDVRCLSVEEIH